DQTVFWWKGNITPPKDWARWNWFIEQYIRHAIERYGLTEVRRWYFEVWNEPGWISSGKTPISPPTWNSTSAPLVPSRVLTPNSGSVVQPAMALASMWVSHRGERSSLRHVRIATCRSISSPRTHTPPSTQLIWKGVAI